MYHRYTMTYNHRNTYHYRVLAAFGWVTLCILLLISFGAPIVLLRAVSHWPAFDIVLWGIILFSLKQAMLSALCSALLAVFVARALARRQFFGRQTAIILIGTPFVLPVIVVILGLLSAFGNQGFVNQGLKLLFGSDNLMSSQWNIYGLKGIIIAHVYFNMPFIVRVLLQNWHAVVGEQLRLCHILNLSSWLVFRMIEFPM